MIETIIAVFIGLITVVILLQKQRQKDNEKNTKNEQYQYVAKQHIMTIRELEFFHEIKKLTHYDIVPQAHLDIFLNEKIRGQDWKYAWRAINQKSVDFLLIDPENAKPILAVEVDDTTHELADRITRDQHVNNILQAAGIPLIRCDSIEELIAKMQEQSG